MKATLLPVSLTWLALLASCTSTPEEVRQKETAKTQRYADYEEKRKIRQLAREERTELWYDRIFADDDEF